MAELPEGLEWGPWFITWGTEYFRPSSRASAPLKVVARAKRYGIGDEDGPSVWLTFPEGVRE